MASLKEKSESILNEKQLNLLPENIKKDITVLGVTGTYDNSSGVKLFETIDEMNSDTNAKKDDLAVVYRSEITNMTSDSVISSITFPEQVVLVEAFTDSVYCMLRAENSSVMFNGNIMLDENSFRFDSFTDSGMIMVEYSSDDGITYNRTRFENDIGALTNPVDLGTNVIVENVDEWSDIIGQFILVGGNIFEGLFNYKKVDIDNQLTLNPMSLDISDESINLIQAGPILDYAILKNAATYLSQFYDDELQFDAYIDYENKVHIVYAKSGFNSLQKIFIINKDNPIIYMGNKGVDEPVEHFDAIYNDETKTYENEQKITFTKMFTNINSQGFYCTKINGYPICAIGISNTDYDSWRHFNHTIYYLDTIDSSTNININDTKLKLNEMVTKYVIAPNQFTANSNNLYNAIAYGKDGVINGNITGNVSNSFADINAEIYYKLQNIYDSMQPRVLTDEDKTIDKNIYFIPIKRDGTSLIDTSQVTDMSSMFSDCNNLDEIPLLDTSNVTNMGSMFSGCDSLTTIPQLNTNQVINMSNMFANCKNLQTVPQLNTSNVTIMTSMFSGCRSLQTIPLLDTKNVTSTNNMLSYCTNLQVVPQLDISKVTNTARMFGDCTNLVTIPVLNISSATTIGNTFINCPNLSDDSLNNILATCLTAKTSRTLEYIGLTQEQAEKCTTLSNYEAFTSAGWTTGY